MADARGRSLSDFVSGVQLREIKDALHSLHRRRADGATARRRAATACRCRLAADLRDRAAHEHGRAQSRARACSTSSASIEKRLTGAPSLIVLDEAWLMLGSPDIPRQDSANGSRCCARPIAPSCSPPSRSPTPSARASSTSSRNPVPTKICLPNGGCARGRHARVLPAHRLQRTPGRNRRDRESPSANTTSPRRSAADSSTCPSDALALVLPRRHRKSTISQRIR
jgi:hypothetical protein